MKKKPKIEKLLKIKNTKRKNTEKNEYNEAKSYKRQQNKMQISREGVTRPPLYFVVWDTGYQFLLRGAVASYLATTVFKPSDVLKVGATNKKVSIRTNTHGFVFAVLIFNPIFLQCCCKLFIDFVVRQLSH